MFLSPVVRQPTSFDPPAAPAEAADTPTPTPIPIPTHPRRRTTWRPAGHYLVAPGRRSYAGRGYRA